MVKQTVKRPAQKVVRMLCVVVLSGYARSYSWSNATSAKVVVKRPAQKVVWMLCAVVFEQVCSLYVRAACTSGVRLARYSLEDIESEAAVDASVHHQHAPLDL